MRNPQNFKFHRDFEVVKLSVFKCIEVFCKKGEKDFNAYSTANNSLEVDDSKRSFTVRFLWQVCVPDSFSKIAPVAKVLASKKWLFWVYHRLLMVFY